MTKKELINKVNRELDISFALPYKLHEEEIERIIDKASQWFYENYKEAVEIQYFIIRSTEFQKPEFKKTRTIRLPEDVVSVYEVKEIKGGSLIGSIDKDFSDDKLIAAELYLTPFTGDALVFRTAQFQYWDLTRAFIAEWIRYSHNRLTHSVKILGRDPHNDVLLTTYIKIPEENLYEDYYFFEYVVNKSKISLANMITLFDFNLIGGIKVNISEIKSQAESGLEKTIQAINDVNLSDWFFIYH